MKIKHFDLEIDNSNPFLNCKLNREQYAQTLTEVLRNYSESFVLAINNEWGTGKTTFIKMWNQSLRNEGFETLYFNAWENDFEDDVLVALISELQELKELGANKKFSGILKKAAPLTKNIAIGVLKTQIEKYAGSDVIKDISNITKDSISICLEEQIKQYKNRKQSISEFKKSLEIFVSHIKGNKPLIFFIDELDRCRPSYAVEVLEQVKQLFLVPGIVFILAVDKTQLCHAIRGVYGNENINSEEYLRRFIDIEYSIPAPNAKEFCTYLYEYFQFSDFFKSNGRLKYPELHEDGEAFLKFSTMLFEFDKLPLRVQEKILGHARLALCSFSSNHYVLPNLFVLLVYLKLMHNDIYEKIKNVQYSLQELIDNIENLIPINLKEYDLRTFLYTEAVLLITYNASNEPYHSKSLFKENSDSKNPQLSIKSKIDTSANNESLTQMIISLSQASRVRYYDISIKHLTRKIDFTEPFFMKTTE